MAIEIVHLPIDSMVMFHSYVAVYQRLNPWEFQDPRLEVLYPI